MKKLFRSLIILTIVLSFSLALGQQKRIPPPGKEVIPSADCSWLTFYGALCQDIDDGKIYKWDGITQTELAAGASGDMTKAEYDVDANGKIDGNKIDPISADLITSGTLNISTINLPSSNADPGTTAGQIKHDTVDTLSAGGVVKWYDGTDVRSMIDTKILGTSTLSANVKSLLAGADYSAMRTLLGLVPGTNVQAYDADLTTYAGITPSANVQSLLGAADYSAMRTLLSLVPGTNVQTYDATLAALAALTITQGSMIQGTGTDAFSVLAKGTTRQILQMNTGATAFEWTSSMDGIIIGASTPAAGTFTALTANSVTLSKTSGIAGDVGLYEANSTDTDAAGFTGPSSLTSNTSYRGRFPNARATSANMVFAWTNAAETGTGTPADPYIQAMSFVDLDNYALLSGPTFTGLVTTLASASGGAGLNVPHGAAPSSPVNGDVWTTTAGVYARINGGTVGPFGVASGDVTGGSASGSGEIAAYGDTGGKLIGRSYVSFSGPASTVKAKTISNAADTIAELGQTNNFSVSQTISKVNAAGGSADALTLSGTLGIMDASDTFRGIYLNYTNANHTGTSNNVVLVDIPAITGDANANFYGIRVGNFTGTTGAAGEVERFLSIGTGFDHGIYSLSPVYIGDGTNGLTISATGAVTLAGTAILPAITSTTVSATTSAQLAGVISDETGSGALVFGTGPAITAAEVDGHTDTTNLTAAQQSNTTIHNVGQGANAVTLNLDTLVNGMSFTLDVGEAQTSHRWRIKAQSGQYIYLLGSDGTTVTKGSSGGYIGVTSPAVGNCLACKAFKDGASSVGLQCKVVSGTFTQE